VSVCLSKGLGAPVGSVLCGPRDLIDKARRWRKVLGGGMRQAGMLAAAGIYALQNHVERLQQDHENAHALAQGLQGMGDVAVEGGGARTNMVFMTVAPDQSDNLNSYLAERDILVGKGGTVRLVTHLDVDRADIDRFLEEIDNFFERAA
jgi:threonine aldolase